MSTLVAVICHGASIRVDPGYLGSLQAKESERAIVFRSCKGNSSEIRAKCSHVGLEGAMSRNRCDYQVIRLKVGVAQGGVGAKYRLGNDMSSDMKFHGQGTRNAAVSAPDDDSRYEE